MKTDLLYVDGDDLRVVNAARVSFDKESEWVYCSESEGQYCDDRCEIEGIECPTLSKKDQRLIRYLARNNHWTPFAQVSVTMREKVPIFVARQRFKHTIGFDYNEVSRRYVDSEPEFYTPSEWRERSEDKKQGSSGETVKFVDVDNEYKPPVDDVYLEAVEACEYAYKLMLDSGVCPEQARMILPQSMYTEYYVKGSLAAWHRAWKQRSHPHAQKEIQDLARMWDETLSSIPEIKHSWEALKNEST